MSALKESLWKCVEWAERGRRLAPPTPTRSLTGFSQSRSHLVAGHRARPVRVVTLKDLLHTAAASSEVIAMPTLTEAVTALTHRRELTRYVCIFTQQAQSGAAVSLRSVQEPHT